MLPRSLLRIAAIPAFATVLAVGSSASAAPVSFGGNSYDLILDDQVSWSGARDAASSAGGTLAVISSAAEQGFIESLLLNRNAPTGSYWFGFLETGTEGVYSPLGGGTLAYSNFSESEPNDAGGVGEDRGSIYWTDDGGDPATLARRGEWNDLPDSGYPNNGPLVPGQSDLFRAGYLVEFSASVGGGGGGGSPNPIPIPTALLAFPGTAFVAMLAARRMKR